MALQIVSASARGRYGELTCPSAIIEFIHRNPARFAYEYPFAGVSIHIGMCDHMRERKHVRFSALGA